MNTRALKGLASGLGSFRFSGGDFCAGIASTGLTTICTDDSSCGFLLGVAVHGLAGFSGLTLENPVGVTPGDLNQGFRSRLGYPQNSGRVVRGGEAAIDSYRVGHVEIIEQSTGSKKTGLVPECASRKARKVGFLLLVRHDLSFRAVRGICRLFLQ
jgi:hypothetical protein